MTKLIIQIPSYNEEATLGVTLDDLPRQLGGIDVIEYLVIDDGSTDRTIDVARKHGADHIVRLPRHQGLARAFMAGIEACLERGADIIVNTDADNQYRAGDIQRLIAPVLRGGADMVVGARPISEIRHFSRTKKLLQKLGSWVVRVVSQTDIPDAASGFRAFSREAAMQLRVFSQYSYTMETIIQCGRKGMAVTSVPVRTNAPLRPSRLVRNTASYVTQSLLTIIRISLIYRPFRFFAIPASLLLLTGSATFLRFLASYFSGDGAGHVQSLILGSALIGVGSFLLAVAVLGDVIAVNRQLLERIDWRMQRLEHLNQRRTRRPLKTDVGVPNIWDSSLPAAAHVLGGTACEL